jgi:hypothetical protein
MGSQRSLALINGFDRKFPVFLRHLPVERRFTPSQFYITKIFVFRSCGQPCGRNQNHSIPTVRPLQKARTNRIADESQKLIGTSRHDPWRRTRPHLETAPHHPVRVATNRLVDRVIPQSFPSHQVAKQAKRMRQTHLRAIMPYETMQVRWGVTIAS